MDPTEMHQLAEVVADVLTQRGLFVPRAMPAGAQWLSRRLTAEEFAACIEVHPVTARSYFAANKHGIVKQRKFAVLQGQRWKIDIAALPLFGVTPALAAARLAQHHAESKPASPLPVATASETVFHQPR